jgi:hypothetical protein
MDLEKCFRGINFQHTNILNGAELKASGYEYLKNIAFVVVDIEV